MIKRIIVKDINGEVVGEFEKPLRHKISSEPLIVIDNGKFEKIEDIEIVAVAENIAVGTPEMKKALGIKIKEEIIK